jgi:hypothetical protein
MTVISNWTLWHTPMGCSTLGSFGNVLLQQELHSATTTHLKTAVPTWLLARSTFEHAGTHKDNLTVQTSHEKMNKKEAGATFPLAHFFDHQGLADWGFLKCLFVFKAMRMLIRQVKSFMQTLVHLQESNGKCAARTCSSVHQTQKESGQLHHRQKKKKNFQEASCPFTFSFHAS